MSEFFFGVSRMKPPRAVTAIMERVARKHGVHFIETTLPGTGYQRWFAGPNLGAPFDQHMAKAVYEDLEREPLYQQWDGPTCTHCPVHCHT